MPCSGYLAFRASMRGFLAVVIAVASISSHSPAVAAAADLGDAHGKVEQNPLAPHRAPTSDEIEVKKARIEAQKATASTTDDLNNMSDTPQPASKVNVPRHGEQGFQGKKNTNSEAK